MLKEKKMGIDKKIDELTKTFSMDRKYCSDLLKSDAAYEVAKIIVYYKWGINYLPHFQTGLLEIAPKHFETKFREDASFYTEVLSGSILKDLCLIPYFVIRGIESEAGVAVRRSLEHLGMLTHFWYHPEKIAYIRDRETKSHKEAFKYEKNPVNREQLKSKGIAKRFESFRTFGQPATQLWAMSSNYFAHGGTPNNILFATIEPGDYSCGFVNRSLSEGIKILNLLSSGCEILCAEIAYIHGTYGKKYNITPPLVGKGGRLLSEILSGPNSNSNEMERQISEVLFELQQNTMTQDFNKIQ